MRTINRRTPGARAARGFLLLGLVLCGGSVRAQDLPAADPLAAVKDKYSSAAYEDALKLLDDMKPAESDTALRAEVEKHRALCFLALRNNAEADGAIERFVTLDPEFTVDKLDASTWVRDRFRTVRRRVLPDIITKRYEEAKNDVLAKSYEKALPQLNAVLRLLDDADVATMPSRDDLRTLTKGFLDLAAAAAAPPPAPPKAAEPPPAPPRIADMPARPEQKEEPPEWPPTLTMSGSNPREGKIVLEIDEKGVVTGATMKLSVHPVYDRLLLEKARTWKYHPAYKNGVPVPSTREIRILVNISGRGVGQR